LLKEYFDKSPIVNGEEKEFFEEEKIFDHKGNIAPTKEEK